MWINYYDNNQKQNQNETNSVKIVNTVTTHFKKRETRIHLFVKISFTLAMFIFYYLYRKICNKQYCFR